MSCKRYEHWAALHVGGDLGERRTRKLEKHLETCLACRSLVEGLRASQAAVKELALEPVDEEVFSELRRRVCFAVAGAQAPGNVRALRRLRYGLAVAVAFLVLGVALFCFWILAPPAVNETARQSPVETHLESVPEVEEHPVPERAEPSEPPQVVERRELKQPVVKASEMPGERTVGEDLVVKLVTDDPDIIIYWLVARKGG